MTASAVFWGERLEIFRETGYCMQFVTARGAWQIGKNAVRISRTRPMQKTLVDEKPSHLLKEYPVNNAT